VVSGEDGLGDVTLAGSTYVTEVSDASVREFTWRPEDFGIERASVDLLTVDGPQASAAVIRTILAGEAGPARDIVVLNAAAGLLAAGKAGGPKTAAKLAAEAIANGAAETLLRRLVERSHAGGECDR
jgi:anthranilate phosphoribosyltransferase